MYTVRFEKAKSKYKCDHKIIVVGTYEYLDYHSSSPIHSGVCPLCYKSGDWEIRHFDYVVVGCNNDLLALPYYVEFKYLFEYDKEYSEREIVEKLVEVYKPKYIMNGRRCLFHETTGIKEDKLLEK